MFSHFLLTQFNLRNFPKSTDSADEQQWLKWTRERIEIFKIYCLPSILNQRNKNFSWLIFFDKNTPDEFRPFIEELTKHKGVEVCYSDGNEDFYKNYFKEILSRRSENQWLITTRLDNDDALHADAIDVIQQNFAARHGFMIALASGYVLDTQRKVLAHYYYPMSPFISLIEFASAEPVGIFARPHSEWPTLRLFIFREIYLQFFVPEKRLARFVLKHPYWVQVVHGKNVSNSFYRGFPVVKSVDLSVFGMNIRTQAAKITEVFKFLNYVNCKRYFKSLIVKKVLNK